jgi:hypothetical protein
MAVVFISPKQRQRVFFLGITIIFLLILIVIAFMVFLSQPQSVAPEMVFNKPKINIDFKGLDSDQFNKLGDFEEMETQFSYTASTEKGEIESGMINAVSQEVARQVLEAEGLIVTEIKEVELGRDNPFVPYYQVTLPSTVPAATNK